MSAGPSFWEAPGRQEALQRGARRGDSAAQIAAALGCTRNAVIGRAWRTGVQLRSDRTNDAQSRAGLAAAAARRINPIHLPVRSAGA